MMNLLTPTQKTFNSNGPANINAEEKFAEWLLNRKEFTSTQVNMTPFLASLLLNANVSNRKISDSNVKAYALAMKKGKWTMNGQGIVVSDKGILRDGQHRLMAVIEANTSVPMLVSSGVSDEAYKTLDTGQKRTTGQIFSIEGFKNGNTISGGIREYLAYKKGLSAPQKLTGNNYVSNEEIFEWASQYGKEEIEELSILAGQYYYESRFLGPSQILGCILILDELHPEKWKPFMDRVFYGVDVDINTAEYYYISRARKEANSPTRKTPPYIRKALFIKAFNAFLTKRPVKLLAFDAEKELYPRFIGE